MSDSAPVRDQILDTLRLDLVGPRPCFAPHDAFAEEVLSVAPSKWYLTGFLVPAEGVADERSDDDADDLVDELGEHADRDDDAVPEGSAAQKAVFPSSMGLSVLVSPRTGALTARVAWGDYAPVKPNKDAPPEERGGRGHWRRIPREVSVSLPLNPPPPPTPLPGFPDLVLVTSVRDAGLGTGTISVAVFLVNRRPPAPDNRRDAAYIFQSELTLTAAEGFVGRPALHGQSSQDWDDAVADLQYRDAVEYAVGHNVSAVSVNGEGGCREVCTAWMPTADVEKVVPRKLADVELGMEALSRAASPEAVRVMVGPMVDAYREWIEEQRKVALGGDRAKIAGALLTNAATAARRIEAGLAALDDPKVFEAFRIANRAIATAIRQRLVHGTTDAPDSVKAPKWHPFQLAFLLMNVVGTAVPSHDDRKVVDLLFFPTGGGKTEAYLGLAAFAIVLRRLRDPSVRSAGLAVLMRYTLRLLTLDQLGRAATLMCALELERQGDVEKLGRWPFEIGLWVGQTATPNVMGKKGDSSSFTARSRTIAFKNDSGRKPSPIPLENCPWCGEKFSKDSFKLLPDDNNPTDLRVMCLSRRCAWYSRLQPKGLPILAVDEPIYRRLPAFLIATVDKFANLPWVGDTAGLFGKVERYDTNGFYGPGAPGVGQPLGGPLPPPVLVIQDELHLISGPLGTMVGLYETAIDALSEVDGVRPKIVASTATVRRADRQIRALFGRSQVDVFPPPGPNRRDSFFAVTDASKNARRYVGIAALGRNSKVILLRAYLSLLAAAQKAWVEQGGAKNAENPADPYMTLLGYFNALRELGGSRRIVEDEVATRLATYGGRRRIDDPRPLFVNRKDLQLPEELTSRVGTNDIANTKRRLALTYHDDDHVDVALATNMISVGLDISRLGLMVVLGQPKTASEYIQATSRVGRDDRRPGLVVTLLNLYRPRDRSHYERFEAWHESFYRSVEATSVTPFSPRAIDRGIAGITVALARLGHRGLTAPRSAGEIGKHRAQLAFVADAISRRAEEHDTGLSREESEDLRVAVHQRVEGLLDAWAHIAQQKGDLQYQREVGVAPPLLFDPLDAELAKLTKEARQFKAGRSLRDVEPAVPLWLATPEGDVVEGGDE